MKRFGHRTKCPIYLMSDKIISGFFQRTRTFLNFSIQRKYSIYLLQMQLLLKTIAREIYGLSTEPVVYHLTLRSSPLCHHLVTKISKLGSPLLNCRNLHCKRSKPYNLQLPPKINIDDLKKNTNYGDHTGVSSIIY